MELFQHPDQQLSIELLVLVNIIFCKKAKKGGKEKKLDTLAPSIADPRRAHSTSMYSRLFCQDRNLCLDRNRLVAQSGKTAITFEPMTQFCNPLGFVGGKW